MVKCKKILLKIHLGILIVILTNFVFNLIFEISLNSILLFTLKILFYVSACILFFYYIKPFKKKALYFSIYLFSPVFIFLGWLMDGIFGALLGSIFLFFFNWPSDVRFENDQIQIKTKFEGLMGACCSYEVVSKKCFFFERKIGEFRFEENLNFRKNDVEIQNNTLQMHLILKDFDTKENRYVAKDTTIYILLK